MPRLRRVSILRLGQVRELDDRHSVEPERPRGSGWSGRTPGSSRRSTPPARRRACGRSSRCRAAGTALGQIDEARPWIEEVPSRHRFEVLLGGICRLQRGSVASRCSTATTSNACCERPEATNEGNRRYSYPYAICGLSGRSLSRVGPQTAPRPNLLCGLGKIPVIISSVRSISWSCSPKRP
jgi:hypothetical protein